MKNPEAAAEFLSHMAERLAETGNVAGSRFLVEAAELATGLAHERAVQAVREAAGFTLAESVIESVAFRPAFEGAHWDFRILSRAGEDAGTWNLYLVDYDDATGSVGEFASEMEAVSNLNGFMEMAVPLYWAKHAKYGPTPVVCLRDGVLEAHVPTRPSPDDEDAEAPAP